jgi:hypothetical protein
MALQYFDTLHKGELAAQHHQFYRVKVSLAPKTPTKILFRVNAGAHFVTYRAYKSCVALYLFALTAAQVL